VGTPLGDFLRHRRHELGIDRKTLAAMSGLSYPYVSQLETSGSKRPSEKALRLLAPALEVELADLLEVAEGWTSGSLSKPDSLRSTPPRVPTAYADTLFGSTAGDDVDDARHELVPELSRRLRRYSPTARLAVLHELQAQALAALAREQR